MVSSRKSRSDWRRSATTRLLNSGKASVFLSISLALSSSSQCWKKCCSFARARGSRIMRLACARTWFGVFRLPDWMATWSDRSGTESHNSKARRAAIWWASGSGECRSGYKKRGDFSARMTVRFSASAGEESLAKKASTNTLRCGSVKGRRKAAATNRAAKARTLSRRCGSSSRVPASRSMWCTTRAAVSRAPWVVASSHALETEMPRANP